MSGSLTSQNVLDGTRYFYGATGLEDSLTGTGFNYTLMT